MNEVEPDDCVAKATTPVFTEYVDVDEIGLMGVRISCTGREGKSHRSVFDFTKMFVFLSVTPASPLAAFVGGTVVANFDVDSLGLAAAMLRFKAANAAALAADVWVAIVLLAVDAGA